MSYDLFFRNSATQAPGGFDVKRKLKPLDFQQFFKVRPNYEVGETHAFYQNQDTGVYFSFDLTDGESSDDHDEDEAEDEERYCASFNMNYYRPHYFALEAVAEIGEFLQMFKLDINDPQNDGMGDGPFSDEGFLKSWNAGNRFSLSAILSHPHESDGKEEFVPPPCTLPTERLRQIWAWNYERRALQDAIGQEAFAPKIMFLEDGSRALTAAVWPDACPIRLPQVDIVLAMRSDLAAQEGDAEAPDFAEVPWATFEPYLRKFPLIQTPIPHHELDYFAPPNELMEAFVNAPTTIERRSGIACDQILDAELVAEALAKRQ